MAALDPFAPADPLAGALQHLRMNGAFYCRSELSAPWGMALMPMPGYMWFHVVAAGGAWVESGPGAPVRLEPGELALVPHGEGHRLRSAPGVPAPGILELDRELVSDRYEVIRHGGGGAPTALICGAVRFEHPAARNVVDLLPAVIHVAAGGTPRTERLLGTLDLLADELAMSRSAFAARFTELVGEPVMSYVARWRMHVAVAALKEEGATVGELADRLGYRSEAAFSRAFKRVIGVAPGAVRRRAQEPDPALAGIAS